MKRILNLGCGNDTYGTHFIDKYPKRKEIIKLDMDIQKIPFPNNYFDEIFSRNLFEHLTNPGFFLSECRRVLKKGGKLTIITDNASYWFFHIPSFSGHYDKVDYSGKDDYHFALFTSKHLRNFMKKFNFRISSLEFFTDFENPKIIKYPPLSNETFLINHILSKIKEVWAFPHIIVKAIKK